jgi:hypothetical protein
VREQQGDLAAAATVWQRVIDSHTDKVSLVAVHLGLQWQDQGDPAGAAEAFETAADSGQGEYACRLGNLVPVAMTCGSVRGEASGS